MDGVSVPKLTTAKAANHRKHECWKCRPKSTELGRKLGELKVFFPPSSSFEHLPGTPQLAT